MDEDLFVGTTMKDQVANIKELLKKYPDLVELFGSEWLEALAQPGQDINSVHPLFWYFANPFENESFAQSILRLMNEVKSHKSFVSELKATTNFGQLTGSIREMETYNALREKSLDVVWKPAIEGSDKVPDLLINGKQPIYLEIFSVTQSEEEIKEERTRNALQAGINKIKGNPFLISLGYKKGFNSEVVNGALQFIDEQINSLKGQEIGDEREREITYAVNGVEVLKITFRPSSNGRGFWASGGGETIAFNNSGRLKNKILDKIQGFQLPPKESKNHLNGYLIFLEPILYTPYDVVAAVQGQPTISFRIGADVDEPPIEGHARDGVIHHKDWDEAISKNLDFIASSRSRREGILRGENSHVIISEGLDGSALRDILFND